MGDKSLISPSVAPVLEVSELQSPSMLNRAGRLPLTVLKPCGKGKEEGRGGKMYHKTSVAWVCLKCTHLNMPFESVIFQMQTEADGTGGDAAVGGAADSLRSYHRPRYKHPPLQHVPPPQQRDTLTPPT